MTATESPTHWTLLRQMPVSRSLTQTMMASRMSRHANCLRMARRQPTVSWRLLQVQPIPGPAAQAIVSFLTIWTMTAIWLLMPSMHSHWTLLSTLILTEMDSAMQLMGMMTTMVLQMSQMDVRWIAMRISTLTGMVSAITQTRMMTMMALMIRMTGSHWIPRRSSTLMAMLSVTTTTLTTMVILWMMPRMSSRLIQLRFRIATVTGLVTTQTLTQTVTAFLPSSTWIATVMAGLMDG